MLKLLTEIIAWSQPLLSQKCENSSRSKLLAATADLERGRQCGTSPCEGIAQTRDSTKENADTDQRANCPDRTDRPGHEDHDAKHDCDNRVKEKPARPGAAAQPRVDDCLEDSLEKQIEGEHQR